MPLYLVEREIPAVGDMADEQASRDALHSLDVFEELDQHIKCVQCYMAKDKAYCIYFAADENLIRRHARKSRLPVDRIAEVRRMMKPPDAT